MVKIIFARNAKVIEVLEDVYSREESQALAEQNRAKAFGIFSGIMKAFDKHKRAIVLAGYQKRYEPFWHVIGESVQEYKRRTHYSFLVKPEVVSVTFNGKVIDVDENEPVCHFEGEDHCFENYSKELLQSASHEKEKNLERYLGSKRRTIKTMVSLQDKETVIEPINIRASYLVNQLIKELVKPIQADKVIQETVEIKRLALLLRPVHVFEVREEGGTASKTIEVDAITGDWRKGEPIMSSQMKKRLMNEGMFEVGSELAATMIPGAGVAAALGRKITEHQKLSRDVKQMKAWRKAYEEKHKK